MKKTFLAIALTMTLGFGALAQSDGFFNDWEDFDNPRDENVLPGLPDQHGLYGDQPAPLGTGLLILTALGAGYAVAKRKNRKKVLSLFILCSLTFSAFAEHVEKKEAADIAGVVLPDQQLNDISDVTLSNNLYIFSDDHSFVIVSADDSYRPIVAYSNDSPFVIENMPDNIRYWIGSIDREIQFAIDTKIIAPEDIQAEWSDLRRGVMPAPKTRTSVSPLLNNIQWGQDEPYNNLCPDKTSGDGHCPVGCAATAMAQIMKYWEWPRQGVGSHSYTHETYGEISVNFGDATYDWDNMPAVATTSSTEAQQTAVATLSYHCGVSLDMSYGDDGSGANPSKVGTALKTYFDYSSNISSASKNYYTTDDWIALLKSEINADRPLHYSGWDTGGGGHSFVCDGYDESDNFHFNWGWNGNCDGYYAMGYLSPGQGGTGSGSGCYNESNYIIKGIQPNSASIDAPSNLSASVDGKNVTLTWDAVSDADHYKVYRNGSLIDGNVSGTSFADSGLAYGTHNYSVRSVKSDGNYSHASSVSAEVIFPGPVPTNLTATVSGSTVELSWTAPASETAVLKYADSNPSGYAYGTGSASPFYWGEGFTPEQLEQYAGMAIQSVEIYHKSVHEYTLHIYSSINGALVELATETYNTTTANSWFTVTLSEPVAIDYTHDLIVATHSDDLANPAVFAYEDYGTNAELYCLDGTGFSPIGAGVSWLMRTNITDGTYTYNIYRDGSVIASNVTQTTYSDSGLETNQYNYYVTTNYFGGESQPSNSVVVDVAGGETCDAPTNLTAELDVNNVTLGWTAVAGVATYSIYRNGTLLDDEVSDTYFEEELDSYGTYSYRVRSNCPDGSTSASSNTVSVNYTSSGPVVTNLTGDVDGNQIDLSWTEPEISTQTINYGTNLTNVISYYHWAQIYDESKLSECVGMAVEKVQFYAYNTGIDYTMKLYNGETPDESNLLATKSFTPTSSWTWIDIVLDTPIYVDCSKNLWVTFHCDSDGAITMGTYSGSDYANAILLSNDGVTYFTPSWYGGGTYSAPVKVCMTDYYTYNIYKDYAKLAENQSGSSYSYTETDNGFHRYYLTTNYYGGESQPSSSVYMPAGATKQFLGTNGSEWTTASNWKDNSTATTSDKVWVKNNVVIDANASVNSFYINKGVTATVNSEVTLDISDNVKSLSLNKWLTVESDAAFVSNATDVKATVKRELTANAKDEWTGKWHFLASPVAAANISDFTNNPGIGAYDMYIYDEPDYSWRNENTDSHSLTNEFYSINGTTFKPGRGYLTSYQNNATMSFEGTINTGEISIPVTASASTLKGLNLIGNPYPCSIDWNATSGWTRDVLGDAPYIWIYNDDVDQYGVYQLNAASGTNGVTNVIASCQGFFVKATESGNIVINNDVKTTATGVFRKGNDSKSISIKVSGKNGSDEVMICQTDEGQNNAEKLFSMKETVPSLYLTVDGENYSIVNVGENEVVTIPLGFECGTTGKFTISSNANVELVDKLNGNVTDLSSSSYEFVGSNADNSDRFLVRISADSENEDFVYQYGDELILSGSGQVTVIDCLGRVVISEYANNGRVNVSTLNTGVYVVRMNNKNQKIVVKQ